MTIAIVSFLNISFFPSKIDIQEINEAKAAGESWYATGGTWNYRKKITIDHTKVVDVADPETSYANFPILVSTTGLSNIKANGADIRFTEEDVVSGGGFYTDTTPPSIPDEFTATPVESQITLTWNNPTDSDFVRVKILRKENEAPTIHNDETATIIYEGTDEEYTDINLDNNKIYHYAIFAYDQKPNYSEILSISAQSETGKATIEIPNGTAPLYPDGTLIKIPESFKVYVIINQKKKWIPTPEVFETLGYQLGNITIITKTVLNKIPNYEDNLIRAIGNYKVYLVVNGISRHLPNP